MTKPSSKKPTNFEVSKQNTKSEAVKKIVRVVRQHRLSYDAFIAVCQQVRIKLKMEKPKKQRKLPELLSLSELKKFFKTVQKCGDTQHELMLKLMLYTAVRVSELVNIRVSDVDLDGCKIFIDNGKGSKDRYFLFPSDFRLGLQTYIDAHPGNDFLFESRLNQPFTPRRVQQIMRQYADEAGLEKISDAQKESRKQRLRSLKDLDDAAIVLRNAVAIMLNPALSEMEVRSTVLATVPRGQLNEAIQQVDNISEPMEDTNFKLLTEQYRSVRLFLPKLLELVEFQAGPTGGALVEALEYLKAMETGKPKTPPPTEIIPKAWRKDIVDENGKTNRPAFTLCTLSKLRTSQRRREVFVNPSHRFGDPTSGLLKDSAWDAARPTICRTLNLPSQAELAITTLRDNLHAAFTTVANNFSSNSAVRFELVNGKQELIVSPLDKVEEPESLVALRALVDAKLPKVDLPEVIMEIAARTGFVEEFVHINGNEPRVPDLEISICALLVAEACNTGIEPIVRNDIPALRRGRLLWVDQNHLRNETITAANARLVATQNHIPLVKSWGSGDVASADGVRFVVPVSTVHAGPNPKYFGKGRGITYYNLMSDQFTGTNAIVVPGTLHDALSLLTIVLEQPTELNPTEIITDTGAYTDLIFGLFWSLGYQFSPRLADVGGARLWRIEPSEDYGSLNTLCRDRINLDLIRQNWDDMLRLAVAGHDSIVASISFGFWEGLLKPEYELMLWKEHGMFSELFPESRDDTFKKINQIKRLRNSIAHHEPIFVHWPSKQFRDLFSDFKKIIKVIRWMCPETAKWVEHHSSADFYAAWNNAPAWLTQRKQLGETWSNSRCRSRVG